MASLVPVRFALNEMTYTPSAYLADVYLRYDASAFGPLAFVRAMTPCAFFCYCKVLRPKSLFDKHDVGSHLNSQAVSQNTSRTSS